MKTVSVGLKAELAKGAAKMAVCLRVAQARAPWTVLAFTSHDRTLTILGDDYVGGFTRSDIATHSDLSVDNLNVKGILASGYFTESDLRAGLWDKAECRLFLVNWADLSQGSMALRKGWLGEISTGRSTFDAEFRGLLQALTKNLLRIDQPGCDAVLGDERCMVDLAAFTFDSTLEGVSDDQLTFFDSTRAEDGPAGGVAISGITAANPAVITAVAHGFIEGELVALSGIVGPTSMNVLAQVHPIDADTFSVDIDSSDLPAYISGGLATPYDDSGFFDGGLMTLNTGQNAGISREVKAYVPGQWTLHIPFPYAVNGDEDYTIVAGCDKTLATCIAKFANWINFRGLPFLRGNDVLVAPGRR